jgi:dCTP deaminase
MILSDKHIVQALEAGRIGIDPFDPRYVQPASYDLHLSKWFRFFTDTPRIIDVASSERRTVVQEFGSMLLKPGDFVLGSTMERLVIGPEFCGRLEGKSSLGRLGITIHVTAGFFDPGFIGHATLEIANLNKASIRVYAGMPIAQMSFHKMSSPAKRPYGYMHGAKYQDQKEQPAESQYWKNFPDKILEYPS